METGGANGALDPNTAGAEGQMAAAPAAGTGAGGGVIDMGSISGKGLEAPQQPPDEESSAQAEAAGEV